MVRCPPGECGTTTRGCLLLLALLVVAVYYGGHVGRIYWRYYEFEQAMRSQARFAHGLTDVAIRNRLAALTDSLMLPKAAARNITVARSQRPGRITIETEYRDSVDLPLFKHGFLLRPRAEAPL